MHGLERCQAWLTFSKKWGCLCGFAQFPLSTSSKLTFCRGSEGRPIISTPYREVVVRAVGPTFIFVCEPRALV